MATYQLQILSMDQMVFEGEVESLVAKGTEGYLGVLAHHAPLVTELDPGELTVTLSPRQEKRFQLEGGLLHVGGNQATVLADGTVEEL
jgi:F-type H+-transporting ATPase subunit epsilon